MSPRGAAAAALLLALSVGLLGVTRPPGLEDVVDVRHWSYAAYTRVVIELSGDAEFEIKRLAQDPEAGRPERLYVDLHGVWVGRRFEAPMPVRDGLLEGLRVGQNTLRKSRVVLDLQRYADHRVLRLQGPERVVIDVFGAPSAALPRRPESPASPRPPRSGPGAALPLEARGVKTVVIDPGHGGRDPGAIGVGGLEEKTVTLRLGTLLAKRLRDRGFRVVLTRSDDRTLSLEERTAIAAGADGDVFLSLHCNAARRRDARGVETYYLDASNEQQTLRVAARENGMRVAQFDSLDRTLAVLRVAETSGFSSMLAGLVQREMVAGLSRRWRGVDDLGVKTGPFYVLFLSSMPSVLLEVGFLTHRTESRRLRNEAYLAQVAETVARALSAYRKRVETVIARGEP